MRGEVSGGTHGGVKRRYICRFSQPWRRRGKQVVGGDRGRESYSGNQGMGDSEQGVGMLSRRRDTPRWSNSLEW